MAKLTAKLLGSPAVFLDGKKVAFSYRKADALLYYVLIRRRAARGEAASLLWEEVDTAAALKNLRHAVYTIRKGLGFDIFTPGQNAALELDPAVDIRCDVWDLLEQGDLSAYAGEFLEGFSIPRAGIFDDWLQEQRGLLQTQYLKNLLAQEREALTQGDLTRAESLGTKYVHLDPLEESAAAALMEVYSAQKKYRKAIGVYHDLCKSLSEELSIAPLKETTALYYRIVNEWNSSTYRMEEQSYRLLLGKDTALRRLLALCNGSPAMRRTPCALVEGEAGVGKTYLLDHILSSYDFSDWAVCRGACYPSESHVPFAAWNSVMMDLAGELQTRQISVPGIYLTAAASIFPCLSVGADRGSGAEWDYRVQRDYHAAQESALMILSAAAKRAPLLLVFEDLHWMDKNSLELLSALLRRLRGMNLMVLCTKRVNAPEEIQNFVSAALRDGVMERYPIRGFTREETEQFIRHHLQQEPGASFIDQLYENTGGNALLLVQLLNTIQERPGLSSLPEDLDGAIRYRLEDLDTEQRRLLDLIAAFPDWAPFQALAAILKRDALELIYQCGELKQRMLIVQGEREGALCYAPAHERIRAAVAAQLEGRAGRIVYLRVAQYLEDQAQTGSFALYERLIRCYAAAGDRFKEFQYRVLSLDQYTGMYYAVLPTLTGDAAVAEERDVPGYFRHLEEELAVLRVCDTPQDQLDPLEDTLLLDQACCCIYEGQYDQGLAALDRLLRQGQRERDIGLLARAHLQYIYYGIQTWNLSVIREHLRAGMTLLMDRENTEEFGIYLRMEGVLHMMEGAYESSRQVLRRSIQVFQRLPRRGENCYDIHVAGAYNYMAEDDRMEGNYDQAFLNYDQAIRHNRSLGLYPGSAVFYTDYGVAAAQKGEDRIARSLFTYAAELYRSSREFSCRPIAMSYLAYYQAEDGDYDGAALALEDAFQVCGRIGSPWWLGVTLYQCWRIRVLLDGRGEDQPRLRALWPESKREHCIQCLVQLNRLQPTVERTEMEQALAQLST